MQKVIVYCGKSDDIQEEKHSQVGYNVVTSLLKDYEHKGYIVTCDNFFSSPNLFWDLLKVGMRTTRVVRTDRK